MIVKINNKDVVLSPRIAADVLTLGEWAEEHSEGQRSQVIIIATAISQSLKATAKRLNWFRALSYRKYTPQYLINNLSALELSEIFLKVKEVEDEGVKKKIMETVNESAEIKQSTSLNTSSGSKNLNDYPLTNIVSD